MALAHALERPPVPEAEKQTTGPKLLISFVNEVLEDDSLGEFVGQEKRDEYDVDVLNLRYTIPKEYHGRHERDTGPVEEFDVLVERSRYHRRVKSYSIVMKTDAPEAPQDVLILGCKPGNPKRNDPGDSKVTFIQWKEPIPGVQDPMTYGKLNTEEVQEFIDSLRSGPFEAIAPGQQSPANAA